jgi:hypothetical protein
VPGVGAAAKEEMGPVGLRFNPPPGWPAPPEGFSPPPGWQPDPSWPPPPPGWQLWVDDSAPSGTAAGSWNGLAAQPSASAAGAGLPPFQPMPQPGAPPGLAAYPAPGGQPSVGTNGMAIASFVLGLIGGVVLSVIFSLIALSQIRRRQQGGRGFAVAGLVLSGAWVTGLVAFIAAAGLLSAHRSASGQITRGGTVSIFSLRVGDCFQNPSGNTQLSVRSVTAVPCATPHNAQTFAAFPATGSGYPGNAALVRQASQGCQARVAGNLDQSRVSSTMTLRFLFPEQQSWADGHRTITCLVEDSRTDLTSSLLVAHPAG